MRVLVTVLAALIVSSMISWAIPLHERPDNEVRKFIGSDIIMNMAIVSEGQTKNGAYFDKKFLEKFLELAVKDHRVLAYETHDKISRPFGYFSGFYIDKEDPDLWVVRAHLYVVDPACCDGTAKRIFRKISNWPSIFGTSIGYYDGGGELDIVRIDHIAVPVHPAANPSGAF